MHNFLPVVGRGVIKISAFVDAGLASLLPTGAVISLLMHKVSTPFPSVSSCLCRRLITNNVSSAR
jgi:hypothetical protein